jgi:hypothetical protein
MKERDQHAPSWSLLRRKSNIKSGSFRPGGLALICFKNQLDYNQLIMGCAATSNEANGHACCPPGSWPALQVDYAPNGTLVDIGGFKVYEIGSARKALVLFEDIFGIESGRHKIIADTYAALGFTVFWPEFLDPVYQGSIEDIPKILEVVQAQKIDKIKARYQKLSANIKSRGF